MSYVGIQRSVRPVLGSGMGTYALADRSIWSSSEVSDEISRFANEVNGTNNDVGTHRNALIAAGANGTRFWNEWQVFLRDWAAYQAHRAAVGSAAFGTSFTSAIVDLRALANRYNTLEGRFRDLTGVASTARSGDTRPPSWWSQVTDAATSGPGLLLAAGIGVVGLVALAVIATQARAFAQPALSAMRRNSRRRRRR